MQSLSQRTVTFLIKDKKVLLGFKKIGFGQGKYLGIGGKVEPGETNEQAAERELEEEIKVTTPNLQKVGDFTFLFPENPSWSQQVHVYLCEHWQGDPQETKEIRPEWKDGNNLPLTQMWDDAQFWLPAILNGHSLKGEFIFDTELKVIKTDIVEEKFI